MGILGSLVQEMAKCVYYNKTSYCLFRAEFLSLRNGYLHYYAFETMRKPVFLCITKNIIQDLENKLKISETILFVFIPWLVRYTLCSDSS
jgi:hypothetical protein